MARPSEDRIGGYHCENRIKQSRRKGQVCGKLLFAKNGLTIWDDRCENTHSLLGLLRKALDLKYLTSEDVLRSIPELQQKQSKKEGEMASRFDKVMAEISSQVPTVKFDDTAKIMFLTLERLVPREAVKEVLKDVAVNSIHEVDRREALRILTETE